MDGNAVSDLESQYGATVFPIAVILQSGWHSVTFSPVQQHFKTINAATSPDSIPHNDT